jgi:hypothetical protein
MATFFDSKQEVIDFQITPHGKRLLSKGKFKPTYYSFVDEGVVYDNEYGGVVTELQNNIESRIQDETPVLKVLTNTYGVERDIKQKGNVKEKLLIDNLSNLSNSGFQTEYAPSWQVTLLKNTIINTSPHYISSDGFYVRIPQINLSCSYKEEIRLDKLFLQAKQTNSEADFSEDKITFETSLLGPLSSEAISPISLEEDSQKNGKNSTFLTSRKFNDGTLFVIEEDEIVIDLMQLNVGTEEEYEVEVYKYDKDKNGNEILTQLDFIVKENENIINDILIDLPENYTMLENNNNKVDYFMDLSFDKQIEQRIVCNYIVPLTKGKGINNNLVCKNTKNKIKTGKLYNNNTIDTESSIVLDSEGNAIIQENNIGAIDPTLITNKVIC